MTYAKALVTGGCGFVGRHFVRRLLVMGAHVTIVDDLSSGRPPEFWASTVSVVPKYSPSLEVHIVDLRAFMHSSSADYDIIFHCAAVVGGRVTIEGNPIGVATDLAIDAELFNWVVKSNPLPKKLVYFSSSAAYPIRLQGLENSRTLSEDLIEFDSHIGIPDMTYGWAKLTGEFLARHAARRHGLNVVCYRPFSGYGEDQDFTYPFPSIIKRIGRHENPIVIWGSGNQRRDFIYIEDIVDAVFATVDELQPGEVLNLGSGQSVSFRQLAELACRVIGCGSQIHTDPTKPEGVFSRVAECTRLFRWYHPTTTLERGIEIVHDYHLAAGLLV